MKTLHKLIELLSLLERKQAKILLFKMFLMALLDAMGVASILPFMALLTNPHLIETNEFLSSIYRVGNILGINSIDKFTLTLGIFVFLLLVLSMALKAATTYSQLHFILLREYSIGRRLVESYLHQPYCWFLNRHSTDLGRNILSEVGSIIHSGMMPMMTLIAQGLVVLFLLILLILIDPLIAISMGIILILTYSCIFKLMSSILIRTGMDQLNANQNRFAVVNEAFSAAKEIKVRGLENFYILRFTQPAQAYAKFQARAQIIAQLPRFGLETIAFGGMMLLVLILMLEDRKLETALPIISLYALAGYRLMPALQQIYYATSQLRYIYPALEKINFDYISLKSVRELEELKPLILTQAIELNNIQYFYPDTSESSLKDISLVIKANTKVAIVGETGSGKTTILDIILGLLVPQQGEVKIDGQALRENTYRAWQRSIGYVPQQIYISDDTIEANIAFGVDIKDIKQESVERAAKIANLHEFITTELTSGYQTTVGERGVRLSGGQLQRIGIARALYHNPQVLILDEATSALDNLTELAVMDAIQNLGQEITVIIVAHRLSSVRHCDCIFFLEKGKLSGQGTFDELVKVNKRFNDLAEKR